MAIFKMTVKNDIRLLWGKVFEGIRGASDCIYYRFISLKSKLVNKLIHNVSVFFFLVNQQIIVKTTEDKKKVIM